jgi:sugar phosphate isomerase/epimerase
MKFGCCSTADNAALLANLGYDYIELGVSTDLDASNEWHSPLPALQSALASAGIAAEAFNLFIPASLKITGPDHDLSVLIDYSSVAIERAAQLGGKIIVFGSGAARQVPQGYDFGIAKVQIVDFLKAIADMLETHNMQLVIEPLQKAECNIINSVNDAVEIAIKVKRAHVVNVLSDLYHVRSDNQSFAETADARHRLQHVHVALGADRHAPRGDELEALTSYFLAIRTAGYHDRVSIEAKWTDMATEAGPALEVLQQAWTDSGPWGR